MVSWVALLDVSTGPLLHRIDWRSPASMTTRTVVIPPVTASTASPSRAVKASMAGWTTVVSLSSYLLLWGLLTPPGIPSDTQAVVGPTSAHLLATVGSSTLGHYWLWRPYATYCHPAPRRLPAATTCSQRAPRRLPVPNQPVHNLDLRPDSLVLAIFLRLPVGPAG